VEHLQDKTFDHFDLENIENEVISV